MAEKGIPYFDDINCVPSQTKWHLNGVRNLYTVKVSYNGFKKPYVLTYGTYSLAINRYLIESSIRNVDWRNPCRLPSSIDVLVTTYDGTKKICEDNLMNVVYNNSSHPNIGELSSDYNKRKNKKKLSS